MEEVKLMEGQSLGQIGMISTKHPHEDCGIKWENTTEDLKKEFMMTWDLAIQILEGKHDTNRGHNIMSVLEKLGQMINDGEVEKRWSFDWAYEKAVEVLIAEMREQ